MAMSGENNQNTNHIELVFAASNLGENMVKPNYKILSQNFQ